MRLRCSVYVTYSLHRAKPSAGRMAAYPRLAGFTAQSRRARCNGMEAWVVSVCEYDVLSRLWSCMLILTTPSISPGVNSRLGGFPRISLSLSLTLPLYLHLNTSARRTSDLVVVWDLRFSRIAVPHLPGWYPLSSWREGGNGYLIYLVTSAKKSSFQFVLGWVVCFNGVAWTPGSQTPTPQF